MVNTNELKRLIASILLFFFTLPLFANHIRGGEMYYSYIGPGTAAGTSKYKLTLKLYIDCLQNNPGQIDDSEPFSIFRRGNNTLYQGPVDAPFTHEQKISYDPNANPCILNAPSDVCYRMRYYEATVDLADSPDGYIVAFQRCCRIASIVNLAGNSSAYGATYLCEIPGNNTLAAPEKNSSPVYAGNDAVAICAGTNFTFDFSASDPVDKDSLVYSLCSAYNGGGQGAQSQGCTNCPAPIIASAPPYNSLPYSGNFSGSSPMSLSVSIDAHTGILSGTAPANLGQYVVTACVSEYRKGVLINIHRKDIHLRIADCKPLKALLKPDYSYCDDLLTSFKNEQFNPTGTVYIWSFGDNTKLDTSLDASGRISHQYADTGTYVIKLKAILAGQCTDSTTALARVYPGFYPGFTVFGSCKLNPFTFTDTTKAKYGVASKWRWEFGDPLATNDTSHVNIPSWKYTDAGIVKVTLIVESNKGCIDTVSKDVEIRDRPLITVPFKDTLICDIDTLQLSASSTGPGIYSWAPAPYILNAATPTPLVFPKATTSYSVTLDDNGCVNTETINVRVVSFVTLNPGPDTTICLTDAITLRPSGDGLKYLWSPPATLDDPNKKFPIAKPGGTTVYTVTASIGKCNTTRAVTITTVPYPGSRAGADTTICYRDTAQLKASIAGSSFTWTPVSTLINPQTLSPYAYPLRTTSYILTVYDNIGCPKPGIDTVVVTVRPPILANAGKDTNAVVNQPVKLTATGATLFQWSPSQYLNNSTAQSPIAIFPSSGNYTYNVKVYTPENCFAYDTIHIKVFQTAPDIFVPNAFTPDKVQNNIFRPIPVGISQIDFFRVYNRWGQMVYSANQTGSGWDGKVGGKIQASDTYVWMVQGKDFTGKTIFKKGTVILIR